MAEVMKPDWPKTGALPDAIERPGQITWFHRPAIPRREHELVYGPLIRTVTENPHLRLLNQCINSYTNQRKLSAARRRLHGTKPKPPTDPHELLPNPDDAILQIDVAPAQTQDLAAPEAVDQQ